MQLLKTEQKNNVLKSMIKILKDNKQKLVEQNQKDLALFSKDDQALYDRLIIDGKKVDSMAKSVEEVLNQEDPVGKLISKNTLDSGLKIENKTTPFGTIMIIYESRPDVTIEAAVLAFKSNNKILLKGGKEAYYSNKELVSYWHQALTENGLSTSWITIELDRAETQKFLKDNANSIDLIVPRGGERLIEFVKTHAKCPVLVSGRGNNFMYVSDKADWKKTLSVIVNAKTDKISACNALDKVLFNKNIEGLEDKISEQDLANSLRTQYEGFKKSYQEAAKPDFLDMDKDGNKKEPMKKAISDKK